LSESTSLGDESSADAEDERLLSDLAQVLRSEAVPTLGLESRLHAGVRRHRREALARRDTLAVRAIGASLVFTAAAFQGDAAAVVAGVVIALAYAALIVPSTRRLRGV
jgi:hypothetical protein